MSSKLSAKDRELKAKMERALTGEETWMPRVRGLYELLPSDPRCTLCLAPFEGMGGWVLKGTTGKRRSTTNALYCNHCEEQAKRLGVRVELELSLLFADVRGSTGLAEALDPSAYGDLIGRFYSETTHVLIHSHAIVDKLAGDQVSGYYLPGIAGPDFAARAVEAALELQRAVGSTDPQGPWVPVGVGVHTGRAVFGVVDSADGMTEITALGDAPNVAARLASNAAAGQVLVSQRTADKAALDTSDLEHRRLTLKGKSEPTDIWVLCVAED
ncbi:MAG: adenylate/guanylate cyclase domain-containing protein [Candidatus Promineifilaceae bacterium]|nr:adenylate/guanylate cyclase domain-containing protein [Candidatus Promineifilaceae bacterium]